MSIFKSTFSPSVKAQLDIRQQVMRFRNPNSLQYMNSRNAWIRLSSSVDVDGKSDLAKKYILQGGTLKNVDKDLSHPQLKSGLGNDYDSAYSNIGTVADTPYQRGIRPMPGITSVDIKSKSAYGSLREAVISFQCWDIQQLEDLEVLYMRPGYTVLLEWGWAPYIKPDSSAPYDSDKCTYESNFTDYYDIIFKSSTDRTQLFKDLYNKSVTHGGNYDAMFGYVKNYQWNARVDGGYDCQTTIITTGEIIESLKINYLAPVNLTNSREEFKQYQQQNPFNPAGYQPSNSSGLLVDEFTGGGNSQNDWGPSYQKNILAGIWAETYWKIKQDVAGNIIGFNPSGSFMTDGGGGAVSVPIPIIQTLDNENSLSKGTGNSQVYITLGAMCDILTKYVIAKGPDKQALVKLTLKSSDYDGTPTAGSDLLCIAHPLQISINPGVCLIKSPLWMGGEVINTATASITADRDIQLANEAYDLIKNGAKGSLFNGTSNSDLISGFYKIQNYHIYELVQSKISTTHITSPTFWGVKSIPGVVDIKWDYGSLEEVLKGELEKDDYRTIQQISNALSPSNVKLTFDSYKSATGNKIDVKSIKLTPASNSSLASSQIIIAEKSQTALENLQFLNSLPLDYFYNGEPKNEIGVIKNIYVNVDYLHQMALDNNLESSDPNGKKEINLYGYLKRIISDIQASIGNINTFEIHVDPVDNNVARIIDINYTEPEKALYENLFELQVHNLNSVVRTYSLQSQIFPNQSAMIAIGSQAKGGQLGMQNNTMIDFNRKLTDRIIPEKYDGIGSELTINADGKTNVTNALAKIINDFSALNIEAASTDSTTTTNYQTLVSDAKTALHDLISYFQALVPSPGSNRNLIPTKFSCEMDGIGGLVIGHMFKLPKDVMPKGYRGEEYGSQLGNAITSISHTISDGDWVTKIDTLNIVLDNTKSGFNKIDLNDLKTVIENETTTITAGSGGVKNYYPEKPILPFQRTYIPQTQLASYLKTKVKEGLNKNIAIAVMAKAISEQGEGNQLKGFNNNFYGVQTDSARWASKYDSYIIGTVEAKEGGTGKMRGFAAFSTPEIGADFVISNITRRGIYVGGTTTFITKGTKVNTPEDWVRTYYKEWVKGNAKAEPDAATLKSRLYIYTTATLLLR
jgi:hypothetical protein